MISLKHVGRLALVGSALASTPAFAQTTPTPDQASDGDSQEIIVTALRRDERLQDIPASISAISGDALQSRGQVNIEAISQSVPSLKVGWHAGSTIIAIRGVGSTVSSGLTSPTIATYVDGVFLPRSTMALLRAVDLERIEVLRGPQGTLYGRNATGGAINFVSQEPSRDWTGAVTASTGSRSAFGVNGFVSGPLASGVYLRLSGGHEEQDGYVKVLNTGGELGGSNVDFVRGALRLEPSERLSIDLSARYELLEGAIAWQQLLTPSPLPTTQQTTAPNRIFAEAPYDGRVETLVVAGTINWELSDTVSLKSITSYVDHKSDVSFDIDATALPGLYVKDFARPSKSYGQEISLIGETGRLQWITGLFYFNEKSKNTVPFGLGPVTDRTFLNLSVDTRTESIAAYADATYSVTDQLKINLGLRYNHEELKFVQNLNLTTPVGVTPIATNVPSDLSSDRLLPKVNIQYQLAADANFYAQWTRGFKSGGQNLPGGDGSNIGASGIYRNESLDAYEIGVKSQLFDRQLTANLAAFYYDYTDLQITLVVPPTTTLVQNAPARVYGVEAELSYAPSRAFRIDASMTYLNARFRDFFSFDDANPGRGVQNLRGRGLPYAPDFTARLGAEYRFDLGGKWFSALTLGGDVNYSSKVILRYFGSGGDVQNPYWQGNLSASLTSADEKTILRAFLNNVGNKVYLRNSDYVGSLGAYFGEYSAPRTFGVSLTRKF